MEPVQLPPIDITPQPEPPIPEGSINMQPTTGPVPPDPIVAQRRARKLHIGIPNYPDSEENTEEKIKAGGEPGIRDTASIIVDQQRKQAKIAAIQSTLSKPGDLTTEDRNLVTSLSNYTPTPSDPKTILEEQYAFEFMNSIRDLATKDPETAWHQADQQVGNMFLHAASLYKTKQEIMQSAYERADEAYKRQSWLSPSYWANRTLDWLPFFWQANMRGSLVGGLAGTALEDQGNKYFDPSMDLDKFKEAFLPEAEKRIGTDPSSAMEWLGYMMGQSTTEKTLNNGFSALDYTLIGGALRSGKQLIKTGVAAYEIRQAFKTALKGGVREEPTRAAIQEAAGEVKPAAASQFAAEAVAGIKGQDNPIKTVLDNLMDMFNGPAEALKSDNPGKFRRELVERLYDAKAQDKANFLRAVMNSLKVEKIPEINLFIREAEKLAKALSGDYPELHNNIMQASISYSDKLNQHYLDLFLGSDGATLFKNKREVDAFIRDMGLAGATPVPQGSKYALKVSHPIDYLDQRVRSMIIPTTVEGPNSMVSSFLRPLGLLSKEGRLARGITPEETLSYQHLLNRKVAVFGPNALRQVAEETLKDFKSLKFWKNIPFSQTRQEWFDLDKVLRTAASTRDDLTGKMGQRFHTLSDLDTYWGQVIPGELPSDRQRAAYFSWKRGEEMYEGWRDFNILRSKLNNGIEKHTFTTTVRSTAKANVLKEVSVEAKRLDTFPVGENASIAVMGHRYGEEKIRPTSFYTKDQREQIIKDIREGRAKMFKIGQPGEYPMRNFSEKFYNDRPEYILTYGKHRSEPVELQSFGPRPPKYDYQHSVKQALMKKNPTTGKWHYEGDRTVMVHNVRQLTKDFAESLNGVRELLKSGDEAAARAYHSTTGLPSFEEVHGWFKPDVTTEGYPIPARLSLEDPIKSVPRDRMVVDVDRDLRDRYGEKFVDNAHEGYHRELGEKYDPLDVFTVRSDGTKANPLYNKMPVKYLDPSTALNRGLKRVINSSFMDDYKVYAIEHWIQEAMPHLNADKNHIFASPAWHFFDANTAISGPNAQHGWKGTDPVIQNLKTSNLQIKQLLGYRSATDGFIYSVQQRLADTLFDKGFNVLSDSRLFTTKDPISYLRSMAFHMKVGLFSVPQLLVQANTFASIYSIAGLRPAIKGSYGALLYGWGSNRHKEIWDALDKAATKFGYRPGEWKEATNFGESSGWFTVAGEHALQDDVNRNDIIHGLGGTVLDAGRWFFNTGEKATRISAFYTAYHEFRLKNPTGALTNAMKAGILQRADTLTLNMSRASSAVLQHGVMSPILQFKTYALRAAEVALGKRLTTAERTRMWGTYATLYGVGVGGLTGLPVEDWIREYITKNNYNVGENYIKSAFVHGLPSLITALASGGEWVNFSDRYGIQSPFADFFKSDKSWMDMLSNTTPSVQLLADTLASTHGVFMVARDALLRRGDYKFKFDDIIAPAQSVSGFESARQLYGALAVHKLIDKHGQTTQDNVTTRQALLQYLSGLRPLQQSQGFTKFRIVNADKEVFHGAEKRALENIRKAFASFTDKDPQQGTDYIRRALAELDRVGYPYNEYSKVFSIGFGNTDPLSDKSDYEFAFGQNVPAEERLSRMQTYVQMKSKK